MKIIICGLPHSGRTTVAKAVAQDLNYHYLDAISWVKHSFRLMEDGEYLHQYEDEYQQYMSKMMSNEPEFITNNVFQILDLYCPNSNFIIDGIGSPKDFMTLFDYRKDMVIFLNRIDNEKDCSDQENIGVSVIRDYCFWLSAASLLKKTHWLEFNFRIPGEDIDFIKTMGAQNSIFIVKNIKKVISHLEEKIQEVNSI